MQAPVSSPMGLPSTSSRVEAARSVSVSLRPMLEGPVRHGIALGRGYVAVGGYCIALVPPGLPRMPNGIECELPLEPGAPVQVGGGCISAAGVCVVPGADWDPVPVPNIRLSTEHRFVPDPMTLAGRGDGLTPAGDDLLVGYVAGLVLFHGSCEAAAAIADVAAPRTTVLSAALLRHAANGELPEPAHTLLTVGDPRPLLRFGNSSGRAMMHGLALACQGGPTVASDDSSECVRPLLRSSGCVSSPAWCR